MERKMLKDNTERFKQLELELYLAIEHRNFAEAEQITEEMDKIRKEIKEQSE